jgi:hypothetical protein
MQADLGLFVWLLALIWFLLYWILGGVFFSMMALLRLGAVRKVRFSCLFTMLALGCAAGASSAGMRLSNDAVRQCLVVSESRAEAITSILGCGFVGILSGFILGLVVLLAVGSVLLKLSTMKTRPWIVLEDDQGKND